MALQNAKSGCHPSSAFLPDLVLGPGVAIIPMIAPGRLLRRKVF
jgi:hypothetical protein